MDVFYRSLIRLFYRINKKYYYYIIGIKIQGEIISIIRFARDIQV